MSAETPGAPEAPLPNVPLIHRPEQDASALSLTRPPLESRKCLLVVDDEPPVLTLVTRILSAENYDILSADSGMAALKLLEGSDAARLDLLVTDLQMPGMSGRDLAKQVRARFPHVRVLYQTGFADRLFTDMLELSEGEAFIEKPFGAAGLLEAVRLVMFGKISATPPQPDGREDQTQWDDTRLRARFVRLLRRLHLA